MLGGAALSVAGCPSKKEGDEDDPLATFLRTFVSTIQATGLAGLGAAAVAKLGPLRANPQALHDAIFAGPRWSQAAGATNWERLGALMREDFETGRVARIDGWVVSLTEYYFSALVSLVLGGTFKAAATTKANAVALPVDLEKGKELYDLHCKTCHQEDGGGLAGSTAPDVRPRLSEQRTELVQSVLEGKNEGNGKMPAFEGKLTRTDANSIVGYMQESFKP